MPVDLPPPVAEMTAVGAVALPKGCAVTVSWVASASAVVVAPPSYWPGWYWPSSARVDVVRRKRETRRDEGSSIVRCYVDVDGCLKNEAI
jgi:hypothetical protein